MTVVVILSIVIVTDREVDNIYPWHAASFLMIVVVDLVALGNSSSSTFNT